MKKAVILFTLLGISLSASAYNINSKKITLSGISAGAYFAQQMHIAYSDQISGVALIAGGPYDCSEGSVMRALNACMKTASGAISIDKIVERIADQRKKNLIDSGETIPASKVFLLSGKNDDVVAPPVVSAVKDLYIKLQVPETNIKYVNTLEVGHAFPTVDYGNPCPTARTVPFISKCNYDGAFEILNFLYGSLNIKGTENEKNLVVISQEKYFDKNISNSMANEAVAYVPTACLNGKECALHVSFHGCMQSRDEVKDDYIRQTGFNAWAEANDIIVLYPQAVKNFMLGNPNSCWDWWGYTGPQYINKQSVQMSIVQKMIEDLKK
jgi:predicted peptidase